MLKIELYEFHSLCVPFVGSNNKIIRNEEAIKLHSPRAKAKEIIYLP